MLQRFNLSLGSMSFKYKYGIEHNVIYNPLADIQPSRSHNHKTWNQTNPRFILDYVCDLQIWVKVIGDVAKPTSQCTEANT